MKTAKLFQNGGSQAVRLPKEFQFEGERVLIKKVGRSIVLFPLDEGWQSLISSLDMFSQDFLTERPPQGAQMREDAFG